MYCLLSCTAPIHVVIRAATSTRVPSIYSSNKLLEYRKLSVSGYHFRSSFPVSPLSAKVRLHSRYLVAAQSVEYLEVPGHPTPGGAQTAPFSLTLRQQHRVARYVTIIGLPCSRLADDDRARIWRKCIYTRRTRGGKPCLHPDISTHLPAKMATSTIRGRFATSGGIDYVYIFRNVLFLCPEIFRGACSKEK